MEDILPIINEETLQSEDSFAESSRLVGLLTVFAEVDIEQRAEKLYQKELESNSNGHNRG